MKDWYPNVEPQSSVAPYALNVSDEGDKFNMYSWRDPTYGPKTVQTGLCQIQVVLTLFTVQAHEKPIV